MGICAQVVQSPTHYYRPWFRNETKCVVCNRKPRRRLYYSVWPIRPIQHVRSAAQMPKYAKIEADAARPGRIQIINVLQQRGVCPLVAHFHKLQGKGAGHSIAIQEGCDGGS